MNLKQQQKFFDEFTIKMSELMLRKGRDYSGLDRLSNFKIVGDITGVSAEITCLNLIAIKVARLGQLLNGKTPNNESIDDTIIDLANYSLLLAMIKYEKDNIQKTD